MRGAADGSGAEAGSAEAVGSVGQPSVLSDHSSVTVPANAVKRASNVVLAALKLHEKPATPVCATAANSAYPSKYVGHTSELPQGVAEAIFGPINRTLSTEGA